MGAGLFRNDVVAPPVGLEPTTRWLTASAPGEFASSQLLYHAELRRHKFTRLISFRFLGDI